MRLGDLIQGLPIRLTDPRAASVRVCDITEDSRTVMPGSLYVARKGETADGKQFIPASIASGAVAILTDDPAAAPNPDARKGEVIGGLLTDDVPLATALLAERFYGNPSSKLMVIGVTGTNGKTTTTYLIHQMLNAAHVRCGLIGTVMVDDGTEVAPSSMTTPPSLEISRTLARMLDAGCRAVVLEVSSHSLIQKRVAALSFDAAVFTNLTGDHLDYHKTMDAYADAKAILFGMLPADGVAVVNADDERSERMVNGCRARVWSTTSRGKAGLPGSTVVGASVTSATRWRTETSLAGPWGKATVSFPFVGPHNLMNALQAMTTVYALGAQPPGKPSVSGALGRLDIASISATMERSHLPPGRLQCLTAPTDPVTVYVDYAHTDDALRTVLSVFREILPRGGAKGKVSVVFGCGGDRDRTKRPRMGAAAAELADRVYVTSDNPRTEDPRSIIDQIVSGMPGTTWGEAVIEPDREAAIHLAIADAKDGDVIIIAGKGHEDYQILPAATPEGAKGGRATATVKRSFDDRLVARDALARRGIAAILTEPKVVVRPATTPHSSSHQAGTTVPRTEHT